MPKNGQMVRNKTTGEVGIFQNGAVVPVDSSLQGGPISSGTDPADAIAQGNHEIARSNHQLRQQTTGLQNQLTELTIEEKRAKAAEKAEADKAAAGADAHARDKLMSVIANMSEVGVDATDNSFSPGLGETGTSGRFMRAMPGSNAGKDMSADIQNLSANFAFDALQAMRDASKTGGALGAISEKELELLESATANVSPDQSQENFLKNLDKARQAYLAKLAMIDPQAAAELGYDAKKSEAAMREIAANYNKRFGTNLQLDVKNEQPVSGWGKAQVID